MARLTPFRMLIMMRAFALVLALLWSGAMPVAHAHEVKAKGLKLEHPWIRATPAGVKVTAGYVEITNSGPAADRLIGTTLKGAGKGELHETVVTDGIARMRPLADGLTIAPGATLTLKPGGAHIMFLDLTRTFEEDGYVDGTLEFETAGTLKIEFFVEAPAKASSGHEGH